MAKQNKQQEPATPTVEDRIIEAIDALAVQISLNTQLLEKVFEAIGRQPAVSAKVEAAAREALEAHGVKVKDAPAADAPAPASAPAESKKKYIPPTPCEGCGKNMDDESLPHSVGCTKYKANGKPMTPEDLEAEMKDLVLKLAQKAGRDAVVKILTAFGVQRASEVPVAKLPEFVVALRTAVAKAS